LIVKVVLPELQDIFVFELLVDLGLLERLGLLLMCHPLELNFLSNEFLLGLTVYSEVNPAVVTTPDELLLLVQ
jgi:hypothetical protein